MEAVSLSEAIKERVDRLPADVQRKILELLDALVSTTPKGVPGKSLLKFSGIISSEDAQVMVNAVEEGCERVDIDEW
jgi:hypothetical protein